MSVALQQPVMPVRRRRPGMYGNLPGETAPAPAAPAPAPMPTTPPQFSVTGMSGSSDPILNQISSLLSANAAGRAQSMRTAAQSAVHGDSSLAALAGIGGLFGAQSDAARSLGEASLNRLGTLDQRANDEKMLRLKYLLEGGLQKQQAGNPLAQLLGIGAGSFLGPRGSAAGGALASKWF